MQQQQQGEPEPGEVQHQPARATATTGRPQIMQQQQQLPQECGYCLLVYEEQERRPRTLPCGHSFCSQCVVVLLHDGSLTCPSCCADHLAASVDHFPISYALEAMVRELQAAFQAMGGASAIAGYASLPTPRDSQSREVKGEQEAAAGLSRKLRSVIQEQQTSLRSTVTTLQQELGQLNHYRAQLALSRAEHGRLLEELDKLAQQHRAAVELLQEEDIRVEAFMKEGQEVQREVRAAYGQLEQVRTSQQAVSSIDAADHTTVQAEKWLQHSREEIPNSTVLNISCKEVKTTKTALAAAKAVARVMSDHDTSGHMDCTIMEAVGRLWGILLKLEDLQRERPRKRLEAGQVFAVMRHEDGTFYSSKMTRTENKTLMYSLKQEKLPHGASTLLVSKVVEGLDYRSISVFLDMSWPGTSSHRVHIQLEADTPFTRRFVTLCLGHTGLTYCSTKSPNMKYDNDGRHRIVWLEETSDQKAAKNLQLLTFQANECGNSIHPRRGMVVARTDRHVVPTVFGVHQHQAKTAPSCTTQNPKFGIVIKDEIVLDTYNYYCLGCVEEANMRVIQNATNSITAKQQMQVMNCGIVLPL